ncbi:precorrin-6Y C5,15-methyltransferase (decarboxylating) subunit CbiT [Haloimpatiens sp. FM7330]|uniref:precorrin-6Y C5,15-methyltransferase (decarboxylating) subunit CbiT n=1 Tax=Haloimpatiens sp. FM7330 TaxID=3298610 RepID=UPI003638EF50
MRYIKDKEFIRGNCPMTKEEVRILSISKMNLDSDYVVLDVGAGSGSISIQCSKICKNGRVIAIEKDKDALEVILKNKEKFNCNNLKIIEGEAICVEENVNEMFDSIFIGGSGGNIESIIEKYSLKLRKNGSMVLNFITINNVYRAMEVLKRLNFTVECTQIAISKTKGKSYMLMANNPIFIVSAIKN